MRQIILSYFIFFFLFSGYVCGQNREEFNGPFSSWANVKIQFGAKGNGKNDDTKAFQNAIDNLSNKATGFNIDEANTVVFLPAGIYCISSTLVLKGKIGVSIIGEDPLKTYIKWIGKDSNMVLSANGSSYFKIARITWDANGKKGMEGIGLHWKNIWNNDKGRSFAPLNIEVSDNVFIGGFESGVSGGTNSGNDGTGANDSEITIRRCVFKNCTFSGVKITGYNALDYWIWDCRFLQCTYGVNCSFGNYHIYHSYFSGSSEGDVYNTNGYYSSVRGCYSEGSKLLSREAGMSCNPFKRTFQGNTVINPRQAPVQYTHLGKITLWDNKFAMHSDTVHKFDVYYGSFCPGNYEVLSMGNSYSIKDDPIKIYVNSYHKIYSFKDNLQPVIKSSSQVFLNSMDQTPGYQSRKIFDIPKGADWAAIQSVLNQAALLKGQRPIVHFGAGDYVIDKTLEIPAGSDMKIQGDGLVYASVILGKGEYFAHNPLLHVNGPSYISICDLQLEKYGGGKQSEGIVFENIDQISSQARLDQIYSQSDTSLYVNGMNYLYVQKQNSFFNDGNYIIGGGLLLKGEGTARVCSFGGQFTGLTVRKNASFLAKDCWWEGATRIPLDISGSGKITIDGAMVAPGKADSLPTIRIGKFEGNISLMNMYVQGALMVEANNPKLSLLTWNIHFYHKMNVLDFLNKGCNYKGAFLGLNAQCFNSHNPKCDSIISINDQFRNVPDINSFFEEQTGQDRSSLPLLYKDLPQGVSNINISRVSIGNMNRGIVFNSLN